MKSLKNTIFENLYIIESKNIETYSNKQRRKELEKWLKHKKYDDYVKTLNKMLEDPKAKSLLEDGFGGDLGDTKLVFSVKEIPVSQLVPTQADLDLDKSLIYGLTDKESLYKTFETPIELNKPIVTFRENYIIDGHHTWLQSIVLNPKGKILAFNYDGEISPIQMLKVVQGTIAAVKASKNKNNTKLPSNKVEGINLFDNNFNKDKIKKYIETNLDENLIDCFIELIDDCYDWKTTVNWLVERILDVQANNYPEKSAPSRENMPQIFKGGTDEYDNNSAYPNKEGSAMNKLKDDKFMKSITK